MVKNIVVNGIEYTPVRRTQQKDQSFRHKPQLPEGGTLTITNLRTSVSQNDIHELFRRYGKLKYAKLLRDSHNGSLGIAQVCFTDRKHALDAKRDLDGRTLDGKPLHITISREPKHLAEKDNILSRLGKKAVPNRQKRKFSRRY